MTPNEYLDAVEHQLGGISDYALAKQFGVSKSDISEVRRGKKPLNAYLATQCAIALELDPALVIADVEAQREKNPQRAAFWRSFLSRAGKGAGIVLCTLALICSAISEPAPAGAFRRRMGFA